MLRNKRQASTGRERPNSRWLALFSFTEKQHLWILCSGVLFTTCSSALGPTQAIFIGKFGDAVAKFGEGLTDSRTLREQTKPTVDAFLAIGSLTLVTNGLMYAFWAIFGELQARSVREGLFRTLLEKDLDWFEARESGVAALLTRLQTYVDRKVNGNTCADHMQPDS